MEIVREGQNEPLEVFESDIELYLKIFCEKQEIKDLRAMPQSVWNACLMFIRKNVFPKGSNRLKDHNIYNNSNNNIQSNYNKYNYNLVNDVLDIYIYLCFMYDKEISIIGFSNLTGIDSETLQDWGREGSRLSSLGSAIYKKLSLGREESLSNKLATGNKNPVGILAILNKFYGWNLPGVSREASGKRAALSVDELPQIGQVAQIQDIKQIEKQDIVVDE